MSFGKKNSDSDDKKVAESLRPATFKSPFGTFNKGVFTPVESADQIATRNNQNSLLRSLVQNIPTSFDVNQAYNNPFYQDTLNYTKNPINTQRAEDSLSLSNQLSARNQLGSSFDAYQNDLLNRRYDQAYRQAELGARQESANLYQQSFQNNLAALGAVRADQNAYMDTLFTPAKLALNYQQAVSPLQQTLANYYSDNNRFSQQQSTNQLNQFLYSAGALSRLAF